MPPQSDKAPAPAASQPAGQDHVYRVIKGTVGPWSEGHTFAESEFKRIHPLPPKDNELANAMIVRETYHGDLIGRLLALGVVEHAPGATALPTQPGPEAAQVMPSNISIKQSTEDVLRHRAQEQAAMTATEPTPAPPQPPAAPVQHGNVGPVQGGSNVVSAS